MYWVTGCVPAHGLAIPGGRLRAGPVYRAMLFLAILGAHCFPPFAQGSHAMQRWRAFKWSLALLRPRRRGHRAATTAHKPPGLRLPLGATCPPVSLSLSDVEQTLHGSQDPEVTQQQARAATRSAPAVGCLQQYKVARASRLLMQAIITRGQLYRKMLRCTCRNEQLW